ncbi:hypothetical protein K3495_g5857 [Podosphaera aphanis]|nr:hypothetical protein K3495_g5857 [Podosphaera aphanis]
MAPIRRYLRISKYSVLECRIYLDNPALIESWFLNPRNLVLPRVIDSIVPLVIPKLREEFERSKGKGSKKTIKDIITRDDFEVSMFLTDTSSRHFVLTKQKNFFDPKKKGLISNSSKLLGADNTTPINVEDESDTAISLRDIPLADEATPDCPESEQPSLKRFRQSTSSRSSIEVERPSKRSKEREQEQESLLSDEENEKKVMFTTYDGFFIHGRALCLIIRRLGQSGKAPTKSVGHGKMEDWIISTQMPVDE